MSETFYLIDQISSNLEDILSMEDFCLKIELDINDLVNILK